MSKSPNVPAGDPKKTSTYNRVEPYRFKTNSQPKTGSKFKPFFTDYKIFYRVKQYLEEKSDMYYIDFYDMCDELQKKHKEYSRKKRSEFENAVERAFSVLVETYKKKSAEGGDDSSSEISDADMTMDSIEDRNVSNQQMVNLYSKDDSRRGAEEEKVINLSSDEDNTEVREDPKPKRFKQNNSTASHIKNSAASSTPNVPVVNDDVTVTVRSTATKNASIQARVEVNSLHQPVAMDTQPPVPANGTPVLVSAPAPLSTPARHAPKPAVETPDLIRLNHPRKRSRNPQEATETSDSKKGVLKQQSSSQSDLPVRTSNYTFKDIGGCTKVLQEVCKLLVHIRHPEIYAQVGVSPPRGFLLHGPPGCGKTLLAAAIAGELNIPLVKVSGPELIAGVSGESEERIRSLFDQAASVAPCVLFLDEVDAICPNRSTAQREMERRIVAQLLSCLDDLGERENGNRVLVVGATNRPDSLDPALRRAGRFDREVCLGIPDRAARANILRVVCKNLSLDPDVASDEGMDYLASLTPGFVGADLKALTREAAMVAINRIFNTFQKSELEEVEMVEEPKAATDEKVMEVEASSGEQAVAPGPGPGPAPEPEQTGQAVQIEEVHDVDVEVAQEEVTSVKVEEPDVANDEPVVVDTVVVDTVVVDSVVVDTVVVDDGAAPEPIVIAESPVNGEPADKDVVEVVTTEVVDLDITEESLPESQVGEDPRMTITIVSPDDDSQTCPAHPDPHPSRAEIVVCDADEPQVLSETPSEPPQIAPDAADADAPAPPHELAPPLLLPQAAPPEIAPPPAVTSDVILAPADGIPQDPAPPSDVAVEGAAQDDAGMVVEEVVGMALTQQVTGATNWSAELKDLLSWLRDSPPLTADQLNGLSVTLDDFREALHHVQPSAKREGFATVPDVTWDAVGSLASVRAELQLAILAPVRYPDQFERLGISSPTGVLLCGPPGCGKTLLAKAIANEAGVNFISVKGPELLNMYVGESERAVRQVFQRARSSAPCIIFFDELDSFCPRRSENAEGNVSSRVVNQLLTEMDGVEGRSSVFLMAATNRPDILDPAVLRPGRLDKVLYVGLPKAADRFDILRALTKNGTKPALGSDVDLSQIAQHAACEGYSGADLAALVREAGVQALREFVTAPVEKQLEGAPLVVASRHFAAAVAKIRPSVSEKDQKHYEMLRKMYSPGGQRADDTMDTT